nr:hypothetical protein [Tanacetum cinerariifolium]
MGFFKNLVDPRSHELLALIPIVEYPLRRGLALVMISYRLQVKNHSQMAEDLIKKIYNIANTPRKQNEPASLVRDDSQGEACPTDSGFIANQDRATIAKSSTLPRDSAPRVTSPAAKEGNDAPINGRSSYEGEAPTERISNDSEEIARVLTSMDAATILAGEANAPTGSGFIPTAGPPATIVSTGSEKKLQEHIDAQVARELEEQQEREDMRMNE